MNAYANRRFAHKQPVYIKFRLQINISKNPQTCRPLVKGGGFRKKTGGIDLGKTIRFTTEYTCNRISYINKMFPISQSAALTALFTKESLATRWV